MRIGYLYGTNTYPPRSGGSIHVFNLVRHLTARGHEIHSLGAETNPQCVVHPEGDVDGYLAAVDLLYVRIDGWFLRQSRLKIDCLDRAGDIPVVWEINAPAAEALAEQHFGRPTAHRRHRRGIRESVRDARRARRLRRLVKAEEETRHRYAANVHSAITVSAPMAGYAADLGIARTAVIPNGSDPDRFTPNEATPAARAAGMFTVVYAGNSQWPWQGFGLLAETARLAAADGAPVRFVVLDNSPNPPADSLGSNVDVHSRVDYDDAPAYLASADLALCLYHDFHWLEHGFHLSPLKLFDYMASGTAVIGSRLGQIAEVVTDGADGWLTDNDPVDIYALIRRGMQDPEQVTEMGRAARRKILDGHTWAHVAAATEEILTAAVAG